MALLQNLEPPSSEKAKSKKYILNLLLPIKGIVDHLQKFVGRIDISNCRNSFCIFADNIKHNYNRFLPHLAVVSLLIVVALSNISEITKAEALSSHLVSVDPEMELAISTNVDRYTTLIESDPIIVEKASEASMMKDGFALNTAPVSTQITARIEPLPDNSKETVYYVVRNGDTLTGLGWKFEVKLSTLKYVNEIDNVNLLKPGIKIKIPPKGYEVSQSLIDKREKDKQAKLAAANAAKYSSRNTVTRNSTTMRIEADHSEHVSGGYMVPINYKYISRGLGNGHNGIDYVASVGTPIYASNAGTVVVAASSGWNGGYGIQVVVSHGGGIGTRYAHLSRIVVSVGEKVSKGQIIAYSGNTGRSTGPHLHFEKIVNSRTVNPF